MRILVVAATVEEVGSLKSEVQSLESVVGSQTPLGANDSELMTHDLRLKIDLLITGVGMVATAFALGKHLATSQYDLAINLGIAGSFDRDIALGEVVEITKDTIAELGAEDDEEFLTIDKMGFGEGTFYPATSLQNLYNSYNNSNPYNLKTVAAITVNTVHGNESSIKKVAERLSPQLESMEGAAFFYACREMNIPSLQIRAVSNYVEKRNRDNWKIGLAIKNLNTFAIEFLKQFV